MDSIVGDLIQSGMNGSNSTNNTESVSDSIVSQEVVSQESQSSTDVFNRVLNSSLIQNDAQTSENPMELEKIEGEITSEADSLPPALEESLETQVDKMSVETTQENNAIENTEKNEEVVNEEVVNEEVVNEEVVNEEVVNKEVASEETEESPFFNTDITSMTQEQLKEELMKTQSILTEFLLTKNKSLDSFSDDKSNEEEDSSSSSSSDSNTNEDSDRSKTVEPNRNTRSEDEKRREKILTCVRAYESMNGQKLSINGMKLTDLSDKHPEILDGLQQLMMAVSSAKRDNKVLIAQTNEIKKQKESEIETLRLEKQKLEEEKKIIEEQKKKIEDQSRLLQQKNKKLESEHERMYRLQAIRLNKHIMGKFHDPTTRLQVSKASSKTTSNPRENNGLERDNGSKTQNNALSDSIDDSNNDKAIVKKNFEEIGNFIFFLFFFYI